VPSRLRPTAPAAPAAILVGDPGRALMLAQELLEQPRMSNHARGLWGYTGERPGGGALTIQATGMGGPSAALVLADLGKLGVRRVVRVGTCAAFPGGPDPGGLLLVSEAVAAGGSAAAFGIPEGEGVRPDPDLQGRLAAALGEKTFSGRVASFDSMPDGPPAAELAAGDMQTVAVLARGAALGMAAAAVLVVSERARGGGRISDDALEAAARTAGQAAATVL
jgi:uridine phosphorylase